MPSDKKMSDKQKAKRERKYHKYLALNGKDMPETISMNGFEWKKEKVFKHDYFAATGLYINSDGEKIVLKLFRDHSYFGLPSRILSRIQVKHEKKAYLRLQGTSCTPKWIGEYGYNGFANEYIEGKTLLDSEKVDPECFDQMQEIIETMHQRGIAYGDLNKADNFLVHTSGKLYIFDFQISWIQPFFPLNILVYPIFALIKSADFYHLKKHKFKNTLSKEEYREEMAKIIPFYIRLHRMIADPIRKVRRKILRKIEKGRVKKLDGTEYH